MQQDKKHWYDGWFYDRFIAPNQDKMFKTISSLIERDSSIIDIGCGTGRLAFQLSSKCNKVTGIDLSSKNIKTAQTYLDRNNFPNVEFIHGNTLALSGQIKEKFDYAIITYVIHEVPLNEREKFLSSAREIASKIIIGDYLVPRPHGFWNLLNEAVEFSAGSDHYKNFKLFVQHGGLPSLASENNFKVLQEIRNNPSTSHILLME